MGSCSNRNVRFGLLFFHSLQNWTNFDTFSHCVVPTWYGRLVRPGYVKSSGGISRSTNECTPFPVVVGPGCSGWDRSWVNWASKPWWRSSALSVKGRNKLLSLFDGSASFQSRSQLRLDVKGEFLLFSWPTFSAPVSVPRSILTYLVNLKRKI